MKAHDSIMQGLNEAVAFAKARMSAPGRYDWHDPLPKKNLSRQ